MVIRAESEFVPPSFCVWSISCPTATSQADQPIIGGEHAHVMDPPRMPVIVSELASENVPLDQLKAPNQREADARIPAAIAAAVVAADFGGDEDEEEATVQSTVAATTT